MSTEAELAEIRFYVGRINTLIALLREPRLHLHVEGDPYLCCPLCTQCEGTRNSSWNGECHPDCGVSAWNARVEAVLAGLKCDGNHGGPRCADPECWNQ